VQYLILTFVPCQVGLFDAIEHSLPMIVSNRILRQVAVALGLDSRFSRMTIPRRLSRDPRLYAEIENTASSEFLVRSEYV